MRRSLIVLSCIMLLVTAVYPVFAQGPGWGRGGPHMRGGGFNADCPMNSSDLTEEQTTKLEKERKRFFSETSSIRNELRIKAAELKLVFLKPELDKEKAKQIQKEINDLRAQMDEKRLDHMAEVRQIAPDSTPGMGGFGCCGKGRGNGFGRGSF